MILKNNIVEIIMVSTILFFLTGCISGSLDGSVADKDKNRMLGCVNTKFGTFYEFNSSTMVNIKIGFGEDGESSFDYMDTEGNKRTHDFKKHSHIRCLDTSLEKELSGNVAELAMLYNENNGPLKDDFVSCEASFYKLKQMGLLKKQNKEDAVKNCIYKLYPKAKRIK